MSLSVVQALSKCGGDQKGARGRPTGVVLLDLQRYWIKSRSRPSPLSSKTCGMGAWWMS